MPHFDGDLRIKDHLIPTPLSDMENAVIGVEATSYLKTMSESIPAHEPLLAALGGEPISLTHYIDEELDRWKEHKMRPLFVFDGQPIVGENEMTLTNAKAALRKTQKAWDLYAENLATEAVKSFGASKAVRAQDVCGVLRAILTKRKLPFIVAPFSACAQLAYLDTLPEQYIDGIMGSQELLHYDIDDAVICPPTQADWDEKKFHGFVKSDLVQKLGVSSNTFADALLMIGTSFLPPFPPLEAPLTRQPFTIMEAINQLRTSNKSITSACTSFSDILQQRDPRWLEKFQKAQMGIRHCATVKVNGEIHIKDKDGLTQDNADYLGLQLPPELYHYLVKGVVGPRLMNYFGALEFLVYPTLDGVLSEEYKRLVTKTLPPIKTTTAALVAPNLHRGFHFKAIKMKYWFDDTLKDELVHKDEHQESNQKANTWAVRDTQLKDLESSTSTLGGSLSFAVLSLQNKEFPKKSIFKEKKITGLKSKSEVTSNAIWRLLHLRGYVNDQHELTIWGNALATTLKCIEPSVKKYEDIHHVQEAAFLAYELLRFDNLNSRNRHPELIGGALRGSDEDKANCMLIGRTACLLMVRHKLIGYTGPLSKNFLSFYSIIKAVRETDRDLLEAITASMLLGNQINRDRDDLESIGASLPFGTDINIALGIAVKTYLDDYFKVETPQADREAVKRDYATKFLPSSVNIAEDLDVAFDFFNALYEGVKTLGDEIPQADKKVWDSAKEYLAKRR